MGANARALKLMAGEFECPVLLLSQFNRDSAKSKPTYGHLFPGRGKEASERYEKAMEKARKNSEADVSKTLAIDGEQNGKEIVTN